MDLKCQMIMEDYSSNEQALRELKRVVVEKLQEMLDANGILVSALDARVKTAKSLEGKLDLKGYKYSSLSDITDLVGARIVTFYEDEVDRISALVENLFDVDWENSVDKRKLYEQDRFGYMSLHYVCKLPEELCGEVEHPEIKDFRFEIQMRTTLQHVWATVYHDTGYKSDVEVPKEYLRYLSRLAGLLELADDEFVRIRDEIDDYRGKVSNLVSSGKFEDLELNGDTWRQYLATGPFDALNKSIASINRAEIVPANLFPYLPILVEMGMKTLADVEKMRKENSDVAFRLAKHQIGGKDIDILSETIGIQNLIVMTILKAGYGQAGIRMFYDALYGERPRNEKAAERIYKQVKEMQMLG